MEIDKAGRPPYIPPPVMPMKRLLVVGALAMIAAGCQASRPWQTAILPTHDRQMAFDAAREVLGRHFDVAEASWTSETIQTKPQLFEGKKAGTLADVRGAGGRWRQIVYCELDRDGLAVEVRVAVLQQRETSALRAAAQYETGHPEGAGSAAQPPPAGEEGTRPARRVWTDAGYDARLAREILSEIAARVEAGEKREAPPPGTSPKGIVEESRKYGSQ